MAVPRPSASQKNAPTRTGPVRLAAWEIARALAEVYWFEGETVRRNSGPAGAGPGYDHSYLLIFHNRPPIEAYGHATPQRPIEVIRRRLAEAQRLDAERAARRKE